MTDPETNELLPFEIHRQPDDITCGPTCLHAVYRYFGDELPMAQLMAEIPVLEQGGTLGVLLANHALARGYSATMLTWSLRVFDPSWFRPDAPPLRERLLARAERARTPKLALACRAHAEFVERGGQLELVDLEPGVLRRFLKRRLPILTGVSATFLYRSKRERPDDNVPDDVNGDPVGHFVVLTGYDAQEREVLVSDPLHPNPLAQAHTYPVAIDRVVGAIYLGVLTYDANLVIIEPPKRGR